MTEDREEAAARRALDYVANILSKSRVGAGKVSLIVRLKWAWQSLREPRCLICSGYRLLAADLATIDPAQFSTRRI